MTPTYTIPYLPQPHWDQVPALELHHTGWLSPCPIAARAQCCHDGDSLWVRMEAEESPIRATLTGPLDQVSTDSCLEFFFAPCWDDPRYFNLEWNPLGALCLGFGKERPTRVRQVPKKPDELFRPAPFTTQRGWGLTFRIPVSYLRLYFPDYTFTGEGGCNFYKCGDKTDNPHYLAWAPLSCDTPDYHRRQDFGRVVFGE